MREAGARGEQLGLSDDELAFYDALETNDSAVQVLGDETLCVITRELVRTVHANVTIDWTLRENVRANLRRLVKRILRKHGYPGSPAFGGHPASIVPAAYSSVPKTGQNRRTSRPHLALRGTTWHKAPPTCTRTCAFEGPLGSSRRAIQPS